MRLLIIAVAILGLTACQSKKERITQRQKEIVADTVRLSLEIDSLIDITVHDDITFHEDKRLMRLAVEKSRMMTRMQKEYDSLSTELKKY